MLAETRRKAGAGAPNGLHDAALPLRRMPVCPQQERLGERRSTLAAQLTHPAPPREPPGLSAYAAIPPAVRPAICQPAVEHQGATMDLSKTLVIILASVVATVLPAHAVLVDSAGGLLVDTDTDFFLPAAATGDLCVSANPAPSVFVGNAPGAVGCTIVAVAPAAAGTGYLAVPKFPAPVVRIGTATTAGAPPPFATASADWTSAGANPLTRRATHNVAANVIGAGGRAVAQSQDPWFFEPDVTTGLDLLVTLEDLFLSVTNLLPGEQGLAQLFASAAFGIGDAPGQNVLAEGQYTDSLTLGSFSVSDFTLIDQSFVLSPGQTYWLTAEIVAAALSIPQPSGIALLCAGLLALLVTGRPWRSR